MRTTTILIALTMLTTGLAGCTGDPDGGGNDEFDAETLQGMIEAGLQAYDIQAPIALIEAAGGNVTNWTGGPAHRGGQVVAASNPSLLKAALTFLGPYAD